LPFDPLVIASESRIGTSGQGHGNNLWRTGTYPEEKWIESWEILAERYNS